MKKVYICPICNKSFKEQEIITKHSLQCWREHNPNHQPKPAPCKGNITKQEINKDVLNFFERFKTCQK